MTQGMRLLLICCAISFAGCLPPRLLASRDIPHMVAEEATLVGWCRDKDGKLAKCTIEVFPGDVIAPQEILKLQAVPEEDRL